MYKLVSFRYISTKVGVKVYKYN